ncbi:MAG: hypothetical protein AAGG09_04395 [Pseudomonadota bacterium]
MSLSTQLEQLKERTPGCRSVVFGDLSAGTVLRSVAAPGVRQEVHDRALFEACLLLGAEGASILAPVPGAGLDISAAASADGAAGTPRSLAMGGAPPDGRAGHGQTAPEEADDPTEEPIARAIRVDAGGVRLMYRGGEQGDDMLVVTLATEEFAVPDREAASPAAREAALHRIGDACRAVLAGDE